jgi:hypothetical protein
VLRVSLEKELFQKSPFFGVRRLAAAFSSHRLVDAGFLASRDIDKSMSKQSGGKPPHSKKGNRQI